MIYEITPKKVIGLSQEEEKYMQETNSLLTLLGTLRDSVGLRHRVLATALMEKHKLDPTKVNLKTIPDVTNQLELVEIGEKVKKETEVKSTE